MPRACLDLSTPSLGITSNVYFRSLDAKWMTFNSLSRDHKLLLAFPRVKETKTFNSLSRDHRARFRDFPALRGFLPRHPFAQMISKTTI